MRLVDLIGSDLEPPPGAGAVGITSLVVDSRAAEPGALFFALPGARADGARFIADAVAKGAVAIVAPADAALPAGLGVPVLRAADPRRLLARAAARLHPRQPATVLAVTGTSGKTSVAEFTRQLLAAVGHATASVGTLGVVTSAGTQYGALTTPDPVTLHATLDRLAGDGITHLAMEASSHGLDQRRLDGVRLTAGAFTNLGRDHLDYHPSVEAYLAAKARLFETLLVAGQTAVIGADGDRAADIEAIARRRGLAVISTGVEGRDIRLAAAERDGFRQRLEVLAGGRRYDVMLALIGSYQATNALVACGLAVAAGASAELLVPALAGLTGVPGRLEIIGEARGGLAVVDYAHKPEALAAALAALKPFATGRLISVFGCGGDRDRGKRPIMGRISADLADVTIVTDDNPRSEEPAAIRREVLTGAPGAREIGDRAEAIGAALAMMGPGDVVLVAGKGHEPGQIIGSVTIPFSDHEVVRAHLPRGG
jgi:UDP-N-acetylmuramoyl-L-alanyl-D-glutamate--2,6-diaminopimelate ligase